VAVLLRPARVGFDRDDTLWSFYGLHGRIFFDIAFCIHTVCILFHFQGKDLLSRLLQLGICSLILAADRVLESFELSAS
jgi:hypothetical protein